MIHVGRSAARSRLAATHTLLCGSRQVAAYAAGWRDSIFIEYYFNSPNAKCTGYPTEDAHNNFIGIRHLAGNEYGDTSYAEYATGDLQKAPISFTPDQVDFVEYFNLTTDTWQMDNLWKDASTKATQATLHTKLHAWYNCKGKSCP